MSFLLLNILRRTKLNIIKSKFLEKSHPISAFLNNNSSRRSLCLSQFLKSLEQSNDAGGKTKSPAKDPRLEEKKKSRKEAIKITLFENNDSLIVTTVEEAEKLSKRRDLKLIKVKDFDTKTQRPVYKLVTSAEFLSDDTRARENKDTTKRSSTSHKKSEKTLTLNYRIAEHDINARLKNIGKWLAKGHEVRLVIECGSDEISAGEKIYSAIEASTKETGRIVQKRVKNGNIRFSVLPPAPAQKTSEL